MRDAGRVASTPGVVFHARVAPWRVGDVYMRTSINVACTTLAARTPSTIEQSGQLLPSGGGADDRVRREIGGQSADRWIDVKWHQE